MNQHQNQINAGERFKFGPIWARFLTVLGDQRIKKAEESLKEMFRVESLAGKRFLDVGSGCGLFSLAARKLGAGVYSFDYDHRPFLCTQ